MVAILPWKLKKHRLQFFPRLFRPAPQCFRRPRPARCFFIFHPRRKPARGAGKNIAGRSETDGEKIAAGAFLTSRGVVVFAKNFARVSCLAFIFLMHPSQMSVCPSSVRPSLYRTQKLELLIRFCRRTTGSEVSWFFPTKLT